MELISRALADERIKEICEERGISYGDMWNKGDNGAASDLFHAFDNIAKVEAIPTDDIKKMKAEIDKAWNDCDIFIPDSVVDFAYAVDEIIKKYTGVEI